MHDTQVEYKQRISVANVLSRAFNRSAVEQNLNLNYVPSCSLSDDRTHLYFVLGLEWTVIWAAALKQVVQETNKAASGRRHW